MIAFTGLEEYKKKSLLNNIHFLLFQLFDPHIKLNITFMKLI